MKLVVIEHSGQRHELSDERMPSVMEVVRTAGLPIAAQCGGSASCATCHVYVDPGWIERLPPIGPDEDAMLELAMERGPRSRLACQLPWSPALDGLVVELAPGTEL